KGSDEGDPERRHPDAHYGCNLRVKCEGSAVRQRISSDSRGWPSMCDDQEKAYLQGAAQAGPPSTRAQVDQLRAAQLEGELSEVVLDHLRVDVEAEGQGPGRVPDGVSGREQRHPLHSRAPQGIGLAQGEVVERIALEANVGGQLESIGQVDHASLHGARLQIRPVSARTATSTSAGVA